VASAASAKSRGPVDLPLTARTVAHYPLAKAVAGINVSVTAKGMLPLSSCKLTNSTTVTCMQPTPAVDLVIFRTYRSLPALYSAYEARVSQLAQGPFRANFGNCTETMTNGEIGWNHDFKHPSMYPMSEFTSGQITDDKAAGRVYCNGGDDGPDEQPLRDEYDEYDEYNEHVGCSEHVEYAGHEVVARSDLF
jgi:hypothetical protein